MERRTFLTALSSGAALAAVAEAHRAGQTAKDKAASGEAGRRLRFSREGKFKILAVTDLHFGPEQDPYAVSLISEMIAAEKPDLVLCNGDNIMGGDSRTIAEVKDAVDQVARAMEKAGVPWAVVLGNHDREHNAHTGLADDAFFALFEAYPHNLNAGWNRAITGTGNHHMLVWDAEGNKPLANIWQLDSGKGSKDETLSYEWVHQDQIAWYHTTQAELEKRYGYLPALMFFHIPVREFIDLAASKKIEGARGEDEAPSGINSGLFAAVLERKDVMGMFCGHDHENNYIGEYRGVTLGFIGVTGVLNAYPHIAETDARNARLRGGRVFELYADKPGQFKSWVRLRDGSINWEHWNTKRA
ncbi:UDP-2,3-diacylglucosamine pyrophosphatase LpxH [Rhizomicrobium palustre]|uniref:UDP-2,3-diacylglucosamine pyrophosphatase LpxH n=1 Tax=Rhizomicrobium palustre TaxID=189966 RepID=A0A846N007_9PROT|nr:metallophosphoesterase family protein [Rhizomicrobium palustre]NIK88825.1 UDP-2,3-diacylglucosamine pyrophosphatase LpxH [Rhizomicrobium palustre]